MNKLINRIIQIVIISIILLLPLELYFKNKDNDLSKKQQIIESRLDSTVIAILGSSHTNFGIDPDYISCPATNFAFPAQSLYYDCMIIEKYYSKMPNLKIVIFDISVFNFGYSEYRSFRRMCNIYKSEYGIPLEKQNIFDIKNYSSLALVLSSSGIIDIIIKYFDDKLFKKSGNNSASLIREGLRENGFYLNASIPKHDFSDEDGIDRIKTHINGMNSSNIELNTRILENTINKLKSNGIEVIFVSTPCHKAYYEQISPKYINDLYMRVKYFKNKYNIKYYDYLRDNRFELEDYADIDHLNYKGARRFTIILNRDISNEKNIQDCNKSNAYIYER